MIHHDDGFAADQTGEGDGARTDSADRLAQGAGDINAAMAGPVLGHRGIEGPDEEPMVDGPDPRTGECQNQAGELSEHRSRVWRPWRAREATGPTWGMWGWGL